MLVLQAVHWMPFYTLCCLLRYSGANFIELLSTKICLAWNFCLNKNRINSQISTWFSRWANNSWIPVTSNMQQMEIWLVILFLSRKKCHAKQISVLSSSMKLGPALCPQRVHIPPHARTAYAKRKQVSYFLRMRMRSECWRHKFVTNNSQQLPSPPTHLRISLLKECGDVKIYVKFASHSHSEVWTGQTNKGK